MGWKQNCACLTSPAQSRRRATFSVRRTKKGASVGFHARGSDVIIENPDCQLLDPDLIAARETVAQLAAIGGSRKGEISINVTLCANGLDVAASGGKELDDQLRMDLTQACETLRLRVCHGMAKSSQCDCHPVRNLMASSLIHRLVVFCRQPNRAKAI